MLELKNFLLGFAELGLTALKAEVLSILQGLGNKSICIVRYI